MSTEASTGSSVLFGGNMKVRELAQEASFIKRSENGGHSNLQKAAACMVPKPAQTFQPNIKNKKTCDLLYSEYLRLGRYNIVRS
jgi:hypothetical protein